MNNKLTNKHLRNAETQMAVDLLNSVSKFIKSKKHRLELSKTILVKSRELAQASILLNDPLVEQPLAPLPDRSVRLSGHHGSHLLTEKDLESLNKNFNSVESPRLNPTGDDE